MCLVFVSTTETKSLHTLIVHRPITTYGEQGVAKSNVNVDEHTVIYMEGCAPTVNSKEPPMSKKPLEVEPCSPDQKLSKMSRLNFGKVYTVEHNVKVMPVGKVSEKSKPKLRGYAQDSFSII